MIPHTLTLTNFTGIRAGLGLDTITLDLDALTGDAALVALKGPNGAGKSTILDNLHPFLIMPSRAGSYSPRSFSFYDNTTGNAEKVLEWSHGGNRYRSILAIKGAGKAKKTEAYLQQFVEIEGIADDCAEMAHPAWRPVTLPDGTSSDGKVVTYNRCVEHILGTPEMFFTAVFAAQNRTPLSAYKNGEIKSLMSELLGLDHIKDLGDQASEVVKLLTGRLNGCKQELSAASEQEYRRTQAQDTRAGAGATLTLQEHANLQAGSTVRELTQELALVQANAGNLESIDRQRRELNEKIAASRAESDTRITELRIIMDRERQALAESNSVHATGLADINKRIESAGDRLNEYQALTNDAAAITGAISDVPGLVDAEAKTASQLDTLQGQAQELARFRDDRADVRVRFESLKQSGKRLVSELADATTRSTLVSQVPCDGTDMQPKCPLLTDAVKASALIPDLETAIEGKRIDCSVCSDEQYELTTQIDAYGDLPTITMAKRNQHNEIRTQLTQAQELAAKAPMLEQARTETDRANLEVNELTGQRESADEDYGSKRGYIEQRIWDADQRVINEQDKSRLAVLTLQERLTELDTSDTADKISTAESALAAAENTRTEIEEVIQDKRAVIARCDAQIEQLDGEIARADATRKQADTIEAELVSWRLLATGLGNDGIIALSIDDAGPTLASLTNDLLLAAYGPRFTVSIVTQVNTKAGMDKETFDILVFDADRDDQKSMRAMSGGERIWINECLTKAIALYQSQQSGQSYGCMFADESDGALDSKRKEMFVRMKRKVLELGGYEREYFISHTPALWDLADAVIDMEQLDAA